MTPGGTPGTALEVLVASDGQIPDAFLRALAAESARCRRVESADAAVELAMSEDFDIVLLDLELPGIGAGAAADILRRAGNPSLLVALSGGAGASAPTLPQFDTTLSHPVPQEALRALVAQAQARRSAHAGADAWMAEGIDDLLQQFRAELPAALDAICSAARDRDWAVLARHLHRLKGTAGNHGFPRVTEQCAAIEKQLREGLREEAATASLAMADAARGELRVA